MSKTPKRRADGERKRALILETALTLFRDKGFDATTIRDIAERAEISVGSTYHYFPSKQAIVAAYYDQQQSAHEDSAMARLDEVDDLRERLGVVFHSKIEAVRKDRSLLVAIARRIVDAQDPLSAFSSESREVRERAIALFAKAIDVPAISVSRRPLIARGLWALHLASLAYLVNDDSRAQRKTRDLIDGILDLIAPLLPMADLEMFTPMVEQLQQVLAKAGLNA